MGQGTRIGLLCGAVLLAACSPEAAPVPNAAAGAPSAAEPEASAPAVAADAPLGDWLVGTWSFDASCATDFLVRYESDGKLDNSGEAGSWKLDGDTVTETVTERFESGGEAPVKLDPPVTRHYTVTRGGAAHGTITIENRKVPILRC